MKFKIFRGFVWIFQRGYNFLFYWMLLAQKIKLKSPLSDNLLMLCLNKRKKKSQIELKKEDEVVLRFLKDTFSLGKEVLFLTCIQIQILVCVM